MLQLIETERDIEPSMAGKKAPRRFLDFAISGAPMYPVIRSKALDLITPIWLDDKVAQDEVLHSIRRLTGKERGNAPLGRVIVYECAECGDIGCGAITVALGIDRRAVTWADWGYQTNYEEAIGRNGLEDLPDLVFDRISYEHVFADAVNRVIGNR